MCGSEAQQYYTSYNIYHERCSPHEHNQNPRAESAIGSLSMRARALMVHANAPKRFWGFAVQATCKCENHFLPFMRGSEHTCYEAFH
eukprot:1427536-Rhodomonas_salina.1